MMISPKQEPFPVIPLARRQFRVWHTMNYFRIRLFVLEINPGELVRLRCEGKAIDPVPWPYRRNDKLFLRRWDVGTGQTKSWDIAVLFRMAENVKARLELGEDIQPSWERKFRK